MLMMRAPVVRIMRHGRGRKQHHRICWRCTAPSKNLPQRHTRARAFRSHSPANFEFPRPCRRPRRGAHHEHQRDPRDAAEEGRRQSRASHKGFAFTASPSSGGPRPRPQKGPAALPDLMAAANAADTEKEPTQASDMRRLQPQEHLPQTQTRALGSSPIPWTRSKPLTRTFLQ